MQHGCDILVSYAENTGRAELDLLCHLPRGCDSIWSLRRRTSWTSMDSIGAFLKLKPSKCSFFQMEIVYLAHHVSKEGFIWVRRTCAPSWSSHARNVHQSKGILLVVRPLPMLYQQLCTLGPCIVWLTGWWNQDGISYTYTWSGGGSVSAEREDHVSTSIGVPRFQQTFLVGNWCI